MQHKYKIGQVVQHASVVQNGENVFNAIYSKMVIIGVGSITTTDLTEPIYVVSIFTQNGIVRQYLLEQEIKE